MTAETLSSNWLHVLYLTVKGVFGMFQMTRGDVFSMKKY